MGDDVPDFGEDTTVPNQGSSDSANLNPLVLPDGVVLLIEAIRHFAEKFEGRPAREIAAPRFAEVIAPVRQALVNGHVRVECLNHDGSRTEVEPTAFSVWGTWYAAFWDPTTLPRRPEGGIRPGHLIVGENELDRFLPVGRLSQSATGSQARYIPPLLAYALELAERFDLSPNYKFNKKAMQDALRKLVDDEPALEIGTKVTYLATLLGYPAFEAGGGGPGEAGKVDPSIVEADAAGINVGRPPRPDDTFRGVKYPRPRRRKQGEFGR